MKKIYIVLFTILISSAFFSCEPENLVSDEAELQACCGNGEDIPPPPPPPN